MTSRVRPAPPHAPFAAALALALALAGCHRASPAERAARPILEKNAAARGGAAAWRAVESLAMSGKLEAGRPRDPVKLAASYLRQLRQTKGELRRAAVQARAAEPEQPVQLPFAMELKRPHKTRLEIAFQGQTAVQVFDGSQGRKLRPFLGRREVEPFSAEELRLASQQAELDGPLLEAAARGHRVALVGEEQVEGRDAYRLAITSAEGQVRQVWVDAQTFLDVKVDGARRLDGKSRAVSTYLRDYRPVHGLMIPHLLETVVEGVEGSEKITIERVFLNPELDDARFTTPQ
ncbi:outer membrane lipoprotein-sorting protein [Anaeromyxobacter diazotrophicus]|uniref:Outer membrane lipoprotein-sorting protein n=1 Tax=Anaeromyxobacter diazotrophicus TaxID=2590199 RepID=A0A7I9VS45_9BACT|nr:outer membrane lipoprotein-sorting protein [Anaeromyxobacter diazotrophicus]GEJ58889.1 hypothetical protein AMYX_36300 [Anaeromyxobacter diazotrophicus]